MSQKYGKTLIFLHQKCDYKTILTSYDIKNLVFMLLYYSIYQKWCKKVIKCLASLTFYLFSPTQLMNSIIHKQSCKILYVMAKTLLLVILLHEFYQNIKFIIKIPSQDFLPRCSLLYLKVFCNGHLP